MWSSQELNEIGTISIPILQKRNLGLKRLNNWLPKAYKQKAV